MENAVILASGLGTRMRPLTEKTPKPLIKAGGKPMIETVIDGLMTRDIGRIYVVAGYLAEQFGYLAEKYPKVNIIINPYYETVNNISSVYAAREHLKEGSCFICEADLFIPDASVFGREHECSCYYGKFVKGRSDDWVFDTDVSGYITRIGKGGTDCFNMVGISYFTAEDAALLADIIEEQYGKPGFETMFWDEAVNSSLDRLRLRINPVEEDGIIEIDTAPELEEINKRFAKEE